MKYLFSLPGVTSFLSRKICQDPLEKFFGGKRQHGGTNEHPTAPEFFKGTQALRVVGNMCRPSVHGNCRGNKSLEPFAGDENQPLPKRKHPAKTKTERTIASKYISHVVIIMYS